MTSGYRTCPPALPRLSSSERWLKIDCLQITQDYFSHQKQFWKLFLSGWNPVSKLKDIKKIQNHLWGLDGVLQITENEVSFYVHPWYSAIPCSRFIHNSFLFCRFVMNIFISAFDLFSRMHHLNWRGKAFCSLWQVRATCKNYWYEWCIDFAFHTS